MLYDKVGEGLLLGTPVELALFPLSREEIDKIYGKTSLSGITRAWYYFWDLVKKHLSEMSLIFGTLSTTSFMGYFIHLGIKRRRRNALMKGLQYKLVELQDGSPVLEKRKPKPSE